MSETEKQSQYDIAISYSTVADSFDEAIGMARSAAAEGWASAFVEVDRHTADGLDHREGFFGEPGFEVGESAATDTLLQTEIKDWRMADGEGDSLTELQQQAWKVSVGRGGYGGLWIEFVGPDGSKRQVAVEIDKGNVTVAGYRDGDEQDVKMTLCADAVHVRSQHNIPGKPDVGYLFDENGVRTGDIEAPEGLTEEASAPSV